MAHRKTHVLTALRQLALLSPGGCMALPEAFALLRGLVGCDTLNMFWHDARCNLVDFTPGAPISMTVLADYVENFAPHEEPMRLAGMATRQTFQSGQLTYCCSESADFDHRALKKSEFYNRVLKLTGYGWVAGVICRHPDGTPLGGIGLGRELHRDDFGEQEIRYLAQAQPWIEHLLRRQAEPRQAELYTADGAAASALLDAQGKILFSSPGALSLLHLAADTAHSGPPLRRSAQGDVDHLLRRIARPLAAALNGLAALPPALTISNRWGRFHLRAYAMSAFEAGTPMQISLHIERQVPPSLRVFGSPRFLALSPREREVCLHVLAGRSHSEIAREMAIKPSTVIYFTRQLYLKLGITRQAELLPALLSETPSPIG
ncbi:MAG TPA: helix-turn-helix transcriptional regulator [Methylococcaceae bacterium]|nr:helix-turn-helix transcriptional regulator [Methylococcaceae bacterium]